MIQMNILASLYSYSPDRPRMMTSLSLLCYVPRNRHYYSDVIEDLCQIYTIAKPRTYYTMITLYNSVIVWSFGSLAGHFLLQKNVNELRCLCRFRLFQIVLTVKGQLLDKLWKSRTHLSRRYKLQIWFLWMLMFKRTSPNRYDRTPDLNASICGITILLLQYIPLVIVNKQGSWFAP